MQTLEQWALRAQARNAGFPNNRARRAWHEACALSCATSETECDHHASITNIAGCAPRRASLRERVPQGDPVREGAICMQTDHILAVPVRR